MDNSSVARPDARDAKTSVEGSIQPLTVRARQAARYIRRRLAQNPGYQPRETFSFSPKRWTDEALTETWPERKARLARERGK